MNESILQPPRKLARSIAAGTAVIYVVTWEEERLEQMLSSASQVLFGDDRPLWIWTAARGFVTGPGSDHELTDPVDAVSFIVSENTDAICLMKDLPSHFDGNPALVRAVRDAYDSFSSRPGSLVLSHPRSLVPPTLGKELYLLELPLPDLDELRTLLNALAAGDPEHLQPDCH